MVITVNKTNMAFFEGIAPDNFVDYIENPNCFIFGALTEHNGVDGACAGLLITELIREWLTDDLYEFGLYIRWLYVSPVTRQRGLANELMDALYDVLNKSGMQFDGIACEIPLDDRYNLLCNYFVDIGFSLDYDFVNDLFLSREDVISNKKLLKIRKHSNKASSITELPQAVIEDLLHMIYSSGPGFYRVTEDYVLDNIDDHLSCIYSSGSEVLGAAIWIKRPSGLCEMVRMWTKDGSMSEDQTLPMLAYIINNIVNLVDNTEGFLFHCDDNPELVDLLAKYDEGFSSEMVRRATYDRGITDIIDFYEIPE